MKSIRFFLPLCLVLFFSSLCCQIFAQDADPGPGNVTVYSEDGLNFSLYLNGELRNSSPATRVVVPNVSEVPVSFRIVFEKSGIAEIKKNGIRQGTNCLYAIEKNKKGEVVFRMKGCSEDAPVSFAEPASQATAVAVSAPVVATPDQLSAKYANGVITINDGRTLTVKKTKANGMTYPRLFVHNPSGASVLLKYDDNDEKYSATVPMKYEVKDFSNNNAYFTLTVDEGGPAKTWSVKLQNSNGYDLTIE